VKYRIDEPYSQLFAADSDTGIITSKVALNKEQLASMTFSVIAYDLGVPSRSSTATVRLLLREDAALSFDRTSYKFVVFENQSPHTEVGQIAVTSSLTSSSIRYDLFPDVSGTEFDTVAFELNATTGKIYTRTVLDRERQAHFRLRVTARGTAGHDGTARHDVTAMARVSIHVADMNDNRPRVHWPPPSQRQGHFNDSTIRLSTGWSIATSVIMVKW